MEENKFKKGANFFGELARRFQREQIEFSLPENNCLPILMNGQEVGAVIPDGAMRIPKAFVDDTEVSDLCQRTGEIAAEVREYMKLLEDAPSLKASSLSEPYKLLADFNGYVLGGMEGSRGVQFTTWQWTYDHLLTKMEEKITRNTVVITAPRGYMNFRNTKIPFLIISDDCLVIGNREYYGVNECRRIRELMEGYLN